MEKIKILILVVLIFIASHLFSNDYYSYENEIKFINYLYQLGDYDRVINEGLKSTLIFTDKAENIFPIIIRSYIKLNKFKEVKRLIELNGLNYENTYSYTLFKLKLYDDIIKRKANDEFQKKLLFSTFLIRGNLEKAKEYLPIISQGKDELAMILKSNYMKLMDFKQKSPLLAGLMSGIVPGTGKIYAGRTADGIFAMIYILSMIYKTYYTFDKHGIDYFEGWIWGGLSLYFYIGDIYGSIAAVKFRRRDFLEKIENEIQINFTINF